MEKKGVMECLPAVGAEGDHGTALENGRRVRLHSQNVPHIFDLDLGWEFCSASSWTPGDIGYRVDASPGEATAGFAVLLFPASRSVACVQNDKFDPNLKIPKKLKWF